MKQAGKFWLALGVLVLLTPLGAYFYTGPAWGEWSADELKKLGHAPQGLEKLNGIWIAPFKDYSLGNLLCAALGGAVALGLMFLIGRLLVKKDER